MNVIPITLAISLCLTLTFILFFWREQTRHSYSSAERDSLLPLGEESPDTSRNQSRETAIVLELKDRKPRRVHGGCGRSKGHTHDADHPPCADCVHRTAHGHDHA